MTTAPRVPRYLLHKPSGRARVRLDGRDHYLGAYGSDESKAEYARLIAKHAARQPAPDHDHSDLTVAELLARYWQHATEYYRGADGKSTGELAPVASTMAAMRRLYGSTLVAKFSPPNLKALQAHWITAGLTRKGINARCERVRRIIKWAVSEGLASPTVYPRRCP